MRIAAISTNHYLNWALIRSNLGRGQKSTWGTSSNAALKNLYFDGIAVLRPIRRRDRPESKRGS